MIESISLYDLYLCYTSDLYICKKKKLNVSLKEFIMIKDNSEDLIFQIVSNNVFNQVLKYGDSYTYYVLAIKKKNLYKFQYRTKLSNYLIDNDNDIKLIFKFNYQYIKYINHYNLKLYPKKLGISLEFLCDLINYSPYLNYNQKLPIELILIIYNYIFKIEIVFDKLLSSGRIKYQNMDLLNICNPYFKISKSFLYEKISD